MNARLILELVNLFCAGMLAGTEFVTHTVFRAPIKALEAPSQIRFRQAVTLKLRALVPALFFPTALSGIAIAILDRSAPGATLRGAGVAAALLWIAIRAVGTIPINAATLDWNPEAPPTNCRAQLQRAEQLHTIGLWLAVGMFALFLAAEALRLSGR